MTAAPAVASMQASGTFRFGFSTAAEFCAADSRPRNAHNVSAMLDPTPPVQLSPLGFHAAAKGSPLNQLHPAMEMKPTGRVTPPAVTAPIRPGTLGPPKFASVVTHNRAITPMHVAIGVDDNHGTNAAR